MWNAPNCISYLKASFSEISKTFRKFLITHYSVVRGRMLVLASIINHDSSMWERGLSIFVREKYSQTMPLGADTVIAMFPLPT